MHIVKKTGLVPVKSLKRGGTPGVFGVKPHIAHAGVLAGELALADVPAHIPTTEVDDPVAEKQPQLAVNNGEPVVIPEDWEAGHPLTWIKLAKAITGADIVLTDDQKKEGVKPSEVAKDVIIAELQRRAAAETPAE